MKTFTTLLLATALPLVSACSEPEATATTATTAASADGTASPPTTAIGRTVARAMDEARAKLATEDMDLNRVGITRSGGRNEVVVDGQPGDARPKATIKPDGTLLIDGTPVPTDQHQAALLRQYRADLEAIASAGMDIGVQGADLGVRAATAALKGVFTGTGAKAEAMIERDATRIEVAARALCGRMPALLRSQTALAAALPAFQPYATMDQSDVDDCYDDGEGQDGASTRDDVRAGIRAGIRDGIRDAARGTSRASDPGLDAAAEADAAADTGDGASPPEAAVSPPGLQG